MNSLGKSGIKSKTCVKRNYLLVDKQLEEMWKPRILSGQTRIHRTNSAEENDGEIFTKGFQPQASLCQRKPDRAEKLKGKGTRFS